MSAANKPQPATDATFDLLAPGQRHLVEGLYRGAIGYTVRCTPLRRTLRVEGAPDLYGKWRTGALRDAAREWHWLHVLPLIGVPCPRPVAWIGTRRRSLLVTEAVAGRSMDAWMLEADAAGWLPELAEYAWTRIAPLVRRLHDHGLAYRDLYWNHVFVSDPRQPVDPTLLDVERVFRPRLRWRRWVVKDLAGLLASLPLPVSARAQLRFLRSYLAGDAIEPQLVAAVIAKAAKIRRHAPRFG